MEVTLKRLVLKNFKGVKELTADFGRQTTVAGENATGKTTIFDAFTWCLFGKDSQGRTDSAKGGFTVKTVDKTGVAIEKLEHEVTTVLDVNGSEISFTRTIIENWVKPQGKTETVMKGNNTLYLVNGVGVKASAFQEKVAGIVEEQLFKLITNPSYFPSMPWTQQREVLITMAGGVTIEEVAQGREDFKALIAQLAGKELAEYKAELKYKADKIKERLAKCPVEINAIDSVTPEAPDYDALEAELARITAEVAQIDEQITSVAKTARKHYDETQATEAKINALLRQQQEVVHTAQQDAQKVMFESNATRDRAINERTTVEREAGNYEITSRREVASAESAIETNKKLIAQLEEQREAKLTEWSDENAKEYVESTGGLVCPIYQTLCSDASILQRDADAKAKAKVAFEVAKDKALETINTAGKAQNKQLEEATAYGVTLAQQLETLTAEVAAKKKGYADKLAELKATIDNNPAVGAQAIVAGDLSKWVELEAEITALRGQITELPENDTTELTSKRAKLNGELDEVKQKLGVRTTIETNAKRKAEILKTEKELAQQQADLEGLSGVIDELNQAHIDEVENRVNTLFTNVRFRMFDTAINGRETPTCVAMIDGVKYADLNTAAKINAGLDIINSLCKFHDVSAPVFIDNAESVNELFPITSQLIKLVVTTDKKLFISQI